MFYDNVKTGCGWDDLDDQIRNKVNEIADDGGRNSHGKVEFGDQNKTICDHWRVGSYRIFGSYDTNTGMLNFIGWGKHTGRGSSSYKVNLCGRSRSTTATTT